MHTEVTGNADELGVECTGDEKAGADLNAVKSRLQTLYRAQYRPLAGAFAAVNVYDAWHGSLSMLWPARKCACHTDMVASRLTKLRYEH